MGVELKEFQKHYNLAKHNDKVANEVLNICKAWRIIVLYYAALHWMNGFLMKRHPTYVPSGHHSRDKFVALNAERFYKPLRQLEAESENLRYKPPYWETISDETIKNLETDYDFIKRESNL